MEFVSYATSDGSEAAERLVVLLKERRRDVAWDGDLNRIDPLSVLAWIEARFRERTVLVVMSPDYVRAAVSDGFLERLGVRYELRLLRDKIYFHAGDRGCRVVVVLLPGLSVRDLPEVFRGLTIRPFDPGTGDGIGALVEALDALATLRESGPVMSGGGSEEAVRALLLRIEEVGPASAEAGAVTREVVALGEAGVQLPWAFESLVQVAKTQGDVRLVRRVCDLFDRSGSPSRRWLRAEHVEAAKVLVQGCVWYLLRERETSEANAVVDRGIQWAKNDMPTVAQGKLQHALVHQAWAAAESGSGSSYHLDQAEKLVTEAIERFRTLSGEPSEEIGECFLVLASVQLAKYRITLDGLDLSATRRHADKAGSQLVFGSESYNRLALVRAEICLTVGDHEEGMRIVTDVVDHASLYPEVVACARRLRSAFWLERNEKGLAVKDLDAAGETFGRLGSDYDDAECWWSIAAIEPAVLVDFPFSAADVAELGRQEDDPRILRRAVLEHAERVARAHVRLPPPNWALVLKDVRKAHRSA